MGNFVLVETRLKAAIQELEQLSGNSKRIDKLDAKSLYHLCKDYTKMYESTSL
jgi:hypothetical protein